MRKTALLVAVAIVLAILGISLVAAADPPALPADPLAAPAQAFDDFKALYKIGWPITVLAGIVVASRLLGRFVPRLSFLNGTPAAVIAAVASIASAAFDVLALGGSWASVAMAAAVAAAALWHPHPKAEVKS